jgi:hypothetical protein
MANDKGSVNGTDINNGDGVAISPLKAKAPVTSSPEDDAKRVVDILLGLVQNVDREAAALYVDTPDAEFKRAYTIGKARSPYLQEGKSQTDLNPRYINAPDTAESIKSSYTIWSGLTPVLNLLEQITNSLLKAQTSRGTELYGSFSRFEKSAAMAGKAGDVIAKTASAAMAKKRPKTGGSRARAKAEGGNAQSV